MFFHNFLSMNDFSLIVRGFGAPCGRTRQGQFRIQVRDHEFARSAIIPVLFCMLLMRDIFALVNKVEVCIQSFNVSNVTYKTNSSALHPVQLYDNNDDSCSYYKYALIKTLCFYNNLQLGFLYTSMRLSI